MPTFVKKPVEVEAFRYGDAQPDWFNAAAEEGTVSCGETGCSIRTLKGEMVAGVGDYIIQGIKGELYPCKPDIFRATYAHTEEPLWCDLCHGDFDGEPVADYEGGMICPKCANA
jgi:hypothetical protein